YGGGGCGGCCSGSRCWCWRPRGRRGPTRAPGGGRCRAGCCGGGGGRGGGGWGGGGAGCGGGGAGVGGGGGGGGGVAGRGARAPLRDVDAQAPRIEAFAPPDVEAFHLIDVVAHEDERRAAVLDAFLEADAHVHERIARHHPDERPRERVPAAPAEPLLVAAVEHEARIEPDARVVEEDAAVDLADVDFGRAPMDDRARRRVDLQRHARVAREMIERAEGHHAE